MDARTSAQDEDFEAISPTALLIAHFRSFSDIPFACDVAIATHAREASLRLLDGSGVSLDELTRQSAPQAEARYKCISRAIVRSEVRQVLELGCGVSFRGLAMTRDPSLRYVATDLPGIVDVNLRLLGSLPEMHSLSDAHEVFFEPLDVLAEHAFTVPLRHFDVAPLAVVNEGLLGYLSQDEKARVAASVRGVLERCGGVWITPDLVTREQIERAERTATRSAHASIARTTRRSFAENAFASLEELTRFFAGLGFAVETRPQVDGSFALSSIERLRLPPDHVESFAADLEVRTLRLR